MQSVTPATVQSLVGSDLGASDWLLVDQPMVDAFAELTGDRQFIHVDPERARSTPFGGTIAHGFLTMSLIATLMPDGVPVFEGLKMGVNYGFDRVRFLSPVHVGKRVRARHTLLAAEDKGGGRWLTTTRVTIEIEGGDRPALTADWLGMQYI
ncbi:MaoC family dehydratase [Glacieibacterium frigidum]|uniref:MaoC family dehydratase n=1 Tax=Glacieibacterium frigidum TaxID=2593303 RepID=A0A552U9P3_9SPHN|nr:MaoC family dehydratase [Glacieibacterium frigidum]TRW14936.1 MaoC family dehydratase [Glacieibacterium frigidum]